MALRWPGGKGQSRGQTQEHMGRLEEALRATMVPAALTKKAGMAVMFLSKSLPSDIGQNKILVFSVENQAIHNNNL